MLVKVTGAVPVSVTVMDCGLLLLVVLTVPKVRLAGLKVRVLVTAWPAPLRDTKSGLPVALLAIDNDAVRLPSAEGVKLT